jgi:hypothetical protein
VRLVVGAYFAALAFGCLAASVLPLSAMANLALDDIEKLLGAFDPFSMLFGFEACVEKYRNGDRRALVLGRRFLERLLARRSAATWAWQSGQC